MNRVGNLLRERREQLGLSKEDIIRKLRIQIVYLDAIENGDFAFFRGQEYYQQVFVGSYADIVALDKKQIMALLQEDYDDFLSGKVYEPPHVPAHQTQKKESELSQPEEPVQGSFPDKLLKANPSNVAVSEPSLVNPSLGVSGAAAALQSDPSVINDLISQMGTKTTGELNELTNMLKNGDSSPKGDADSEALLNSSIFDEIKKIEDKMDKHPFAAQHLSGLEEEPSTQPHDVDLKQEEDLNGAIDEADDEEDQYETKKTKRSFFSRAPQDEVLGKKMASVNTVEQVDEEVINESLNGEPGMEQVQVFSGLDLNMPMDDKEIIVPQEELISNETNENQINMEDLAHAERATDRDGKTAIDLKVARALGGQEVEVDPNDAKQIKRDKIIDWILVIVAIAVISYILVYLWGFQ